MSRRGPLRLHRQHATRSRRSKRRQHAPAGKHHKHALKHAAMRDCGRRCVYCATPLPIDRATLDHVFPVARGGSHAPGNLVTACATCNRLKRDLLPFEFFAQHPWAGLNFMRYARAVHRALKRGARRAVSLSLAA